MVNKDKQEKPYTDKTDKYLFDLVSSALEGNAAKSELAALSLARLYSREKPALAKKLQELLALYSMRGSAAMRSAGHMPPPVDMDTHMEMATVLPPGHQSDISPVLVAHTKHLIENFLEERNEAHLLLEHNTRPSNSLLLIGQPGTGKTMLAHYIAAQLHKNIVVLDLSASISNMLGKTGYNLKRVLQYAKQTSAVLLLDEFDAIAKKRDDNTDLGEIKRVVNVLLMELEDWPSSSVLIATSNHPELLDRAIWRRFDHVVEVPLPELPQRLELLEKNLKSFLEDKYNADIIPFYAALLEGKSPAEICKFSNNVKRRILLGKGDPSTILFNELLFFANDKKIKAKICRVARDKFGMTIREISKLTGLSIAGVQHHLK